MIGLQANSCTGYRKSAESGVPSKPTINSLGAFGSSREACGVQRSCCAQGVKGSALVPTGSGPGPKAGPVQENAHMQEGAELCAYL